MVARNFMHRIWDKLGICVSGLCLVHCLVTPLVLIFYPTTNLIFEEEFVHQIFGIIVVSSALVAVYPNCQKHGHKDILIYAISGVALILAGIFLHEFSELATHLFTVIGSILLIWAHLKNMKVRHGKCDDISSEHIHNHGHIHEKCNH